MIKTKNLEKYEYAEMLYLRGMQLKVICEKINTTAATLSKWKKQGSWDAKRAARSISVDQTISKALVKVNEMLDDDKFSAENFAKTLTPLKNLRSHSTPDDKITMLMDCGDWAISQIGIDAEITPELVRQLTIIHDKYILKVLRRDNG